MNDFGKYIIKRIRLGNVTQVTSNNPWLQNQTFTETFTYDASDQLVSLLFLCSPKESLRQASKKELVRFLEREQTSPKVTEQKEKALAAVEKNPVHYARQLAERRNRRCERTHSPSLLGPMLSHEEKKMRSILTLPLRSHPSCPRPGFPSFGEIQTSLYSALTIGKRPSPLPCYGRRIFPVTPQVGEMTYSNREIQRIQLWQDATVSSEVPPCNLLFSFLCFVSFFFSGRRKKERNEGKNFYYHTNHLGSTAFVTDANATVTQGFLYAPFGEIISEYQGIAPSSALPKYTFNAKELDEESGMYYYEARYYAPPVFTSRDPMFEKYFWMSPYAYCANNPLKYVDPDGRTIWVTDGKIKYQYRQDNEGNWGLYTIKPNGEIGSAYSKKSNSFIDNVLSDLETIRNTNDAEIQKRFNYIVSSESKRQIIEQQEENVKVSQYAAIKTKDGRYTGKGEIKYNRDDINGGPATLVHELLGHAYSHSMGTFSDDINKIIVIGKNHNNQEQINAINIENIYRHASGMSPRTEDLGSDGFYDVSKYLNQNILKLWE